MPAGAHRNQQKKIDSNNIATVFRKGNAITKLLTDALEKENAGKTGVYYWKKKEARDLFESAGVQFPGGSMQDGLIHSILNNDSHVNTNFMLPVAFFSQAVVFLSLKAAVFLRAELFIELFSRI